jgi:hypothetical protein
VRSDGSADIDVDVIELDVLHEVRASAARTRAPTLIDRRTSTRRAVCTS